MVDWSLHRDFLRMPLLNSSCVPIKSKIYGRIYILKVSAIWSSSFELYMVRISVTRHSSVVTTWKPTYIETTIASNQFSNVMSYGPRC